MSLKARHIAPLLNAGKSWSKYLSYLGLGIGVLLLLCALQLFINIQQLLNNDNTSSAGSDFISITKTVTNETMGTPDKNLFNQEEVEELKRQPFIEDATPLLSNQFRIQASAAVVPFSTDLFIEAMDKSFMDTVPPYFTWKEGEQVVPIVFSSEFLEMYNVLAPGQGYPQLSEETLSAIQITLTCYGPAGKYNFKGVIAGLTSRVNSVLVPKEFLQWANRQFGGKDAVSTSRVFVKTKDANSPDFINFLKEKNYQVNEDKLRFGRARSVLEMVVSGLGIFGLLVVVLALVLFSFYLQLIIAKSKENLQLLLMLGYAPAWLSKILSRRWIPVYIVIVVLALAAASLLQWWIYKAVSQSGTSLSPVLHWSTWVLSALLIVVTIYGNYRMIRNQLYRLH